MKKISIVMLCVSLVLTAGTGCKKRGEQTSNDAVQQQQAQNLQEQPSANPAPLPPDVAPRQQPPGRGSSIPSGDTHSPSTASPGSDRARARQDATSPPPQTSPEPVRRSVELGPGTEISAGLNSELSTKNDGPGTPFTARVTHAVMQNGIVVVPAGSTIHGTVTNAVRAPRVGGKARMSLEFTELSTEGHNYRLSADPLTLEGKSSTKGDVEKVVGGAVGGAVLGGIFGGGKGAVKGGAAGAGAGTVWAVATRGQDIVLEPGKAVTVVLAAPLEVSTSIVPGPNP
jgi:hypothetical protein